MKKIKWLLPLSLVAGSTGLSAVSCTETSYSIEYDITNGHCEGPTKIGKKDEITIKIIPDEHYVRPSKISVSNAEYDYDKTTGEIKIWNAQDNIVISATCIDTALPISVYVGNGTYEAPQVIYPGETATISFIPNQYFTYPKIDDISVIGAEIESYIPETGELTIGNVWTLVGEVLITTDCQAIPFAITCSVNNGSWEGSSVVSHNKPATIQINPSQYYSYPETVIVTNADYTYDNKTGKVTISNPTGDVNVTATCDWDKQYHHVSITPTFCEVAGPEVVKDGEEYTYTITPSAGHVLPQGLQEGAVEGADVKRFYVDGTFVIEPRVGGDNVTMTINCKEGYEVILKPTHCKIVGIGGIEKGGQQFYQIAPDEGYALPDQSKIKVENAQIRSYSQKDRTLVINEPTSTVTITIECEYIPKTFTISGDITNGSLTGATEITEGSDATVTIVPDGEHIAPASKEDIAVDNAAIKSYSPSTGELVLTNPKSNITVTATCPDKPAKFPLSMTVTNGKSDHTDITEIAPDETIVFTITPNQYCALPDTVTVTGAQSEYDKATGKVTVSNPTATVEIKVGCEKIVNSIKVVGDNALAYGATQKYDVNVEFVEGKETSYTTTCNVGSTGCTWNDSTKTLTAGKNECSVDIVVTFPEYGFTYKYTVRVFKAIFTFNHNDTTAYVDGVAIEDEGVTGLIATIPGSVNIDNKTWTVNKVNQRALHDCKMFKQITLPDSMWQLDNYSFDFTSLETIVFSDDSNLDSICVETFSHSSLKGHLVIKSICSKGSNVGYKAFDDCNGITAVTLPANLTKISGRAFVSCDNLSKFYFEGTSEQWKKVTREEDWHLSVPTDTIHCIADNVDCKLDDK